MKRFVLLMVLTFMAATASPCYSFLDYLFGGAHTRDSIDNSAVGDLRAWWSGNPVYQFNPYYSGSPNPAQQGGNMPPGQPLDQQRYSPPFGGGQDYQPQQQANVTFIPPQQQQYGYGAYQPQPGYGAGAPMQYQGAPQAYQQMPQQYQQVPQQYQYPQALQQQPYQQAVPQYYQQPQYQQQPQYYQQPQYRAGPQPYQYQGTYNQ